MTTHLNLSVGTTLEEPLHKAHSLDKLRLKCRSILCLIGIAITLQLPQEQICPCLHQQSNNLSWTFLEQKEHYLKTSIWRSQFCLLILILLGFLKGWKGPKLPVFARLDQAIMPGCQGAKSKTWKFCDSWVLSRAFTVTHHPGTFFTSKTSSFSISAPSLVPLLISLRFFTPRNYGFNCL